MLNLAIPEIILKHPGSTAFVNQESLRSRIIRRPRTSRSIDPREYRIIIHCIPQDLKLLGRGDDYAIAEMLPVQSVVGYCRSVDRGLCVVRPGGRADNYSDFEIGG